MVQRNSNVIRAAQDNESADRSNWSRRGQLALADIVHRDAASGMGAVSGMDDEFRARNVAAPKFRRVFVPVDSIIVDETFGRELDDEHVQTLAEIIEHFGNRYPPIVGEDMRLLAGHPQLAAVQRLGHRTVEVIIEMTP